MLPTAPAAPSSAATSPRRRRAAQQHRPHARRRQRRPGLRPAGGPAGARARGLGLRGLRRRQLHDHRRPAAQPDREALGDERQRLLGLGPERRRPPFARSRSRAATSTSAATFTTIGGQTRNRIAKLSATSGNAFSGFEPERQRHRPRARGLGLRRLRRRRLQRRNDRRPGAQPDREALGDERQRLLRLRTRTPTTPSARSRSRARRLRRRRLHATSAARRATGSRSSRRRAATRLGLRPERRRAPSTRSRSRAPSVYAGGDFSTTSAARTRNRIAKLSATSGNAFSALRPERRQRRQRARGSSGGSDLRRRRVHAIEHRRAQPDRRARRERRADRLQPERRRRASARSPSRASDVYAGGDFNAQRSAARPATRSRSSRRRAATPFSGWNPNADETVHALAVSGADVYAGGDFTATIGGQARNRIAKLSATSGNAFSAWNPKRPAARRSALAVSGSSRLRRRRLRDTSAARRATRSPSSRRRAATRSRPSTRTPTTTVLALAVSRSARLRRRQLHHIGGRAATGSRSSRPRAATPSRLRTRARSSDVHALAVSGTARLRRRRLQARIGGQTAQQPRRALGDERQRVLRLQPGPQRAVLALAVSASTLYAGGPFTMSAASPARLRAVQRVAGLSAPSADHMGASTLPAATTEGVEMADRARA